jgi:hypothetical protein
MKDSEKTDSRLLSTWNPPPYCFSLVADIGRNSKSIRSADPEFLANLLNFSLHLGAWDFEPTGDFAHDPVDESDGDCSPMIVKATSRLYVPSSSPSVRVTGYQARTGIGQQQGRGMCDE